MKSNRDLPHSLTQTVAMYHVGFRMRPADAEIVSKNMVQMTCRLELIWHHEDCVRTSDRPCLKCTHVLEGLFEVLDALRPIEGETLAKAGGTCRSRARFASAGGPEHEVKLGIEMALQHPVATVAGAWTWIFMQRVRTALTRLGCQDCGSAELQEATPYPRVGRCEETRHVPAAAA